MQPMTDNTIYLGPCADCGGYHASFEPHLPPPASQQELGALDAVLHAAPDSAWKSISAMRDYLASRGGRVAVHYERPV